MSDQAPQANFQPEHYTILSISLQIQTEEGPLILGFHGEKWSCVCDHFRQHRTCKHVLEAQKLSFIIQPKEVRP